MEPYPHPEFILDIGRMSQVMSVTLTVAVGDPVMMPLDLEFHALVLVVPFPGTRFPLLLWFKSGRFSADSCYKHFSWAGDTALWGHKCLGGRLGVPGSRSSLVVALAFEVD